MSHAKLGHVLSKGGPVLKIPLPTLEFEMLPIGKRDGRGEEHSQGYCRVQPFNDGAVLCDDVRGAADIPARMTLMRKEAYFSKSLLGEWQ